MFSLSSNISKNLDTSQTMKTLTRKNYYKLIGMLWNWEYWFRWITT